MKTYKFKQKQQGVALAVGMMLLLVVSMIGITSMKSALLQEKMAASLKNREYADAAAIALQAAGESYLHTYYQNSNNTLLAPGIGPIVAPRSDVVHSFKSNRNLSEGTTHPFGISLMDFFRNGQIAEVLAEEPKLLIEDIEASFAGTNSTSGGIAYLATRGETDDGSAGSNSGQNADAGDGSGTGGIEVKKYRIISKATDSTGNLYAGFESVVSVVTR